MCVIYLDVVMYLMIMMCFRHCSRSRPRGFAVISTGRTVSRGKRDLVEGKRDLVEGKRDLVEGKRDLV